MKKAVLVLFAALWLILASLQVGQASQPHLAGLVIQDGNGNLTSYCVEFSEEQITGLELLQRSGAAFVASYDTIGAAICKIGETGCPAEDCFCQSPPDYWSYWLMQNSRWVYSFKGAGIRTITNGDMDGWVWGNGRQPPPVMSLEQVCASKMQPPAPASATASPTASATLTLVQTTAPPVATPSPTQTPLPTNTIAYSDSNIFGPTLPPTDTPVVVYLPTSPGAETPDGGNIVTQMPAPTITTVNFSPSQTPKSEGDSGLSMNLSTAQPAIAQEAAPPAAPTSPINRVRKTVVVRTATPAPSATLAPSPTVQLPASAAAPASGSRQWAGYGLFGVLSAFLGAAVWLLSRRRT